MPAGPPAAGTQLGLSGGLIPITGLRATITLAPDNGYVTTLVNLTGGPSGQAASAATADGSQSANAAFLVNSGCRLA
jgi:hypothetical protein